MYGASDDQMHVVHRRRIHLPDLFTPPLPPALADFAPLLEASPHLTTALQSVTTVAQASLLIPRGRLTAPLDATTSQEEPQAVRPLVVANTHLFFHHDASHIRTMHVAAILREAEALAKGHATEAAAAAAGAAAAAPQALQRAAMLFCGDLNSDVNDGTPGAVQLLSTGALSADYYDWSLGARFSFETGRDEEARAAALAAASEPSSPKAPQHTANNPPETLQATTADSGEAPVDTQHSVIKEDSQVSNSRQKSLHTAPVPEITGVDLFLPQAFESTHALNAGVFTNYVPGYKGLLDYIWVDSGAMKVVKSLPVPPVDTLGGHLPNAWHGSDHLPLAAEVELLDSENGAKDRENGTKAVHASETAEQSDGAPQSDTMHASHASSPQGEDAGCAPSANMGGASVATRVLASMHYKRSLASCTPAPLLLDSRAKSFRGSAGVMARSGQHQPDTVSSLRCGLRTAGAVPQMHAAHVCYAGERAELEPDPRYSVEFPGQVHRIRGSFLSGGEDAGDEGNVMHGMDASAKHAGNVLPATGEFVSEAARCMRDGGVVALPTDTLYGLAALATADEAIKRIYDLKGRNTKV